jgi:hypothetical protein
MIPAATLQTKSAATVVTADFAELFKTIITKQNC